MNIPYQSFEDLRIWKEAMSLCVDVYHAMKGCKEFALRDQLQKSAVSIPSNIAEGYERQTDKEFVRFLYIAKASSGELRTQIMIAIAVHVIEQEIGDGLINKAKKVSGMIQNLIKARRNYPHST
jgi:four helix bundle protein